ncbi:MAG: hypothetical protein ABID64_01665 [Nitrospirota bacterium]
MSLSENSQTPKDSDGVEVEVRYLDEKVMIEKIKKYGERYKFVFSKNEDGYKFLTLGPTDTNHIMLIEDEETLIGGGRTFISIEDDEIKCTAEWGSGTCIEERRYDRPRDENEAKEALDEVITTIRDWVKRSLAQSETSGAANGS